MPKRLETPYSWSSYKRNDRYYTIRSDLCFKHRPLPHGPRSIRLVSVLRELSEDGSIRCHMRHSTTDDAYQCLSYRWGAVQPRRLILLCDWCSGEEKPFLVSQNLHDFLVIAQQRKTCSQDGDTSVNLELEMWIDALCIDQENGEEKNHQVGLMGTIYSKAYSTVIWLGANTSDGQDWSQLYREGPTHLWENAVSGDEYWKRAWITQEVILSRTITVLMGDFARPFLDLACENNLDLRFWRDAITEGKNEVSLLQLLSAKRLQRCELPRDRIYSLLSLVREGSHIKVDYNMSHADLAFDVLRACGPEFCLCHIRLVTGILHIRRCTCYGYRRRGSFQKCGCYEDGPYIQMQLTVNPSSGHLEPPGCPRAKIRLIEIRDAWRRLENTHHWNNRTGYEKEIMERKLRGFSVREDFRDRTRICTVRMSLWAFASTHSTQSQSLEASLPESLCHITRAGSMGWIEVGTGPWQFPSATT